uniref:Uncharacterized protein n=1 Tax=Neovison vison TaxID=452646 RepID=A0A8C7EX63_NEOVI
MFIFQLVVPWFSIFLNFRGVFFKLLIFLSLEKMPLDISMELTFLSAMLLSYCPLLQTFVLCWEVIVDSLLRFCGSELLPLEVILSDTPSRSPLCSLPGTTPQDHHCSDLKEHRLL